MFLAASRTLSGLVTPEQESLGHLLPPMKDLRAISRAVAKAVALEARDSGLGRLVDDATYEELITRAVGAPLRPLPPGRRTVIERVGSAAGAVGSPVTVYSFPVRRSATRAGWGNE